MTRISRTAIALALISVLSVGCIGLTPDPPRTLQPTSPSTASPAPTDTPATTPPATDQPTQTPEPSDSPTTDPSLPTDPPASIDPALAAEIDGVTASVPPIRELEELADVPYEFVTREHFQQQLQEMDDEDIPDEWRAAEERMYKRLGLLADDVNLEALLLELYGGQVAAYYDPEVGRFYIIERDEPFGAVDKTFVSHEYTHALQDQHFDLEDDRITDLTEGDAALAQLAAIEGDATLTMQLWALQNLTPDELFELLAASLSGIDDQTLADMPLILRRQLEFPYAEGFLFSSDVQGLGGFEAVNATLQTPPASSEQILHAQKYYDGELPVDVTIDDLSASLGAGWSRVYEQTMGELQMQVLATGGEEPPQTLPGLPVEWPHVEVAEGWGGDRLGMYEGPDGAWAIDWETAWDTEADADEFRVRMAELQATFDGSVGAEVEGQNIRVVVASDATILQAFGVNTGSLTAD
jgi:hypothetical protein